MSAKNKRPLEIVLLTIGSVLTGIGIPLLILTSAVFPEHFFLILAVLLPVILVGAILIIGVKLLFSDRYDASGQHSLGTYSFALKTNLNSVFSLAENSDLRGGVVFEKYIVEHAELTVRLFDDIHIFTAETARAENLPYRAAEDRETAAYFDNVYDIIDAAYKKLPTAIDAVPFKLLGLSVFYMAVIKMLAGAYKYKLFSGSIYESCKTVGETVTTFKRSVKRGVLAEKDRMLLFYYVYHDKQLKEENIVSAYNEFAEIYNGRRGFEPQKQSSRYEKMTYTKIADNFSVYHLDLMSEAEIDRFIENLFLGLGYDTIHNFDTDLSPVDFIAERDGERFCVMAKSAGLAFDYLQMAALIREIAKCGATQGILITTNRINESARELAEQNRIMLLGRKEIAEFVEAVRTEDRSKAAKSK